MCLYIDAMLYTFIHFFSLFTVRASTQRTNNSKIYHGDEITKEKKHYKQKSFTNRRYKGSADEWFDVSDVPRCRKEGETDLFLVLSVSRSISRNFASCFSRAAVT